MYSQSLPLFEILILIAFFLVSLIPFKWINLKNKLTFANPLIIYNIFFFYYCFFSPIYKVIINNTNLRGISVSDSFFSAWLGSLL